MFQRSTSSGLFRLVTGRATVLRQDEAGIEDLLSRLCYPPDPSSQDPYPRITLDKFVEIAKLLETINPTSSQRPRLYTVRRNLGRLDLLDRFVKEGLNDFYLPLSEQTLPDWIEGDKLQQQFLNFQRCVLTDARELEEPGGPHLPVEGSAQRYFVHIRDLGQGGFG